MSSYFESLNYTLANEDTSLECEVLPLNTNHVVSVCGSGARVLPLLSKYPKKLSLIDFSSAQMALTALRIELVKKLNHSEFLGFLGYRDLSPAHRRELFFELDFEQKQSVEYLLQSLNWGPLIYQGKYEQSLQSMSRMVKKLLGKKLNQIMSFDEIDSWANYYRHHFPIHRWRMLIFLLGNNMVMNALLYKGHHPKNNMSKSYFHYYEALFDRLFNLNPPRHSFFAQLFFRGELTDLTYAPIEANPHIFEKMKAGVMDCHIQFYQGDIINIIKNQLREIDFISFSDVLSYFSQDLSETYMQQIQSSLNTDAMSVHRYYLYQTKNMNTTGFEKVTNRYNDLIKKESTQIYGIDIYQKN